MGLRFLTSVFTIALCICLLSPRSAIHAQEASFGFARLKYGDGNPNPRPNSLKPLREFIVGRTSLEINAAVPLVSIESPEIFNYPLLIWSGDREFSPLSENALNNLATYLRFGGFIFAEDVQGSPGLGFDLSFRREMEKMFPKNALQPLDKEHTVFRSFFLAGSVSGRLARADALEGLKIQQRTVLIYSMNDLQGAWSKDVYGNYEYDTKPLGDLQRLGAFRLGTNIVLYALCDDYKKDALHMNYILSRRKGP